MGLTKIKKGLDLPLKGSPNESILKEKTVTQVAILGDDYVGLKPTMEVKVGDQVKLGQLLFTDKKMPGVKYTSPGTGEVIEINRGERRAFKSLVIKLQGNDAVEFKSYSEAEIENLNYETVKEQLIESGLWTSLKARPFSRVANPEIKPHSIFITSIDTNPLAPSFNKIIENKEKEIEAGLKVLGKLTDGNLYFCKSPELNISLPKINNLIEEDFSGPHPAGNAGTHIHFIDPVGKNKVVWYLNIEDVIRFGVLFLTGKISVEQIFALTGPEVNEPCLIKSRIGADLTEITEKEISEKNNRIVSGSVFSGFKADGMTRFLGRYHRQVTVLEEGTKQEFLGWLSLGKDVYSVKNAVISKLFGKKLGLTTALNGGHRAIVPIGSFEKVMPLDILPTYLLRALSINDIEESEQLGCLELDEEDLALCTFVCPSKNDYGAILRETLTIIEKEG